MYWTSVRDCFPEEGVECLHELHASRWLVRRIHRLLLRMGSG